jgi:hypothetical protein
MIMVSNSEGIWRSGNLLVMRKGAQLPDRCVKTNQPANGKRWKATFHWHHPAVYLLILFGFLIYVIVAIAVRKGPAVVYVGVTEETLQKRRRVILWCWGIGIAGIILVFSASSLQSESAMGVLVLLGLVLTLGGLIGGIAKGTIVNVDRIEDEYVWIRGVTNEYLALLPEWNPE